MKTKLFLHIGTNKTGTSAIQRFFSTNRDVLRNYGLLYPVTACCGEAHYGLSQALGFDHAKKREIEVQGVDLRDLGNSLSNEVEETSAQYVVMSSENFILPRSVEVVHEFLKAYDVRVIMYLRRHDEWWQSAYNQAVKMVVRPPWGRKLQGYVQFQKRKNPLYGRHRVLVDRWAEVFGKENIIVRPYESQQNQPDIVSDFLFSIGLESIVRQIDTLVERTNEALSFLSLNLVEIFQRIDVKPEIRSCLIQHALSIQEENKQASIAPPALRRKLVDENMQDYDYIAREYLGRADGRLFYDALPDAQEVWEEPKHPTFMKVVEETIKALDLEWQLTKENYKESTGS